MELESPSAQPDEEVDKSNQRYRTYMGPEGIALDIFLFNVPTLTVNEVIIASGNPNDAERILTPVHHFLCSSS